MDKKNITPPVVWLRVADFMHAWLQKEYGCSARVKEQSILCLQDLPGMKEVMRMATREEGNVLDMNMPTTALSAVRWACLSASLQMDACTANGGCGLTRDDLKSFLPVECPQKRMTEDGVLRPWTQRTSLGTGQATALQKIIRQAFWDAVEKFDTEYAREMGGSKYPAIDMIEEFCARTGTPDTYAESMRREWQRRKKRAAATE